MGPIQKNATLFNPDNLPMQFAARYERTIGASLARVWENVLDWEHLPHLHESSFSALDLEDAGDWGWRALTTGQPANKTTQTRIELVIDRENSRYVSRTLEGGLPGMEIWTALSPQEGNMTAIQVDFHIPHIDEQSAQKLGPHLTTLYTKLWDEDERMMQERQTALDARAPSARAVKLDLGPTAELMSSLPQTVNFGGRKVCIMEVGRALHAFHAQCPHMLAPLEAQNVSSEGIITCPWHGYQFNIRTGASSDMKELQIKPCINIQTSTDGHTYLVETKEPRSDERSPFS